MALRRYSIPAVALAAVVLAGASAAKTPVRVSLAAKPSATEGASASIVLAVRGSTRRLAVVVRARNGLTLRSVGARRLSARRYRARLSFPFAGTWKLTAKAAGRTFALGSVSVRAATAPASVIPGATAFRICRAAGTPYPQYGLAQGLGSLWVACRRSLAGIERIDSTTGRVTGLIDLPTVDPHALAAGGGALWSAQRSSSVVRIDPRTGAVRDAISVGESSYVFTAAGSVWAPDDPRSTLMRYTPGASGTQEIAVGDGTSALVESAGRVWILNHRDATLQRIDTATNTVSPLGKLPGEAPERMVLSDGSLWVTGRGTDLLRVDPETGAVQATIELGAGGVNVATAAGSIWAFAANAADDRAGLPFLDRILRVSPATNAVVETIAPTARVAITGVVSDSAHAWIADTSAGRLYRVG
jgi:streptogramin lyase